MLVVACNSVEVSALGDIAAARGHPGRRRDRPGQRGPPSTPRGTADRPDRDGGHRRRAARTSGPSPRPARRSTLHLAGLPGVRRARRARRHHERCVAEAARGYLVPLVERGIDTLILGCTHYPLLSGLLQLVLGDDVVLVSSAEETAKDVYAALLRSGLERDEPSRPGARVPLDRRPRAVPALARGLPGSGAPRGARRPGPTGAGRLVELTVLGSSGTWPGPARRRAATSSATTEFNLWVDAGAGTFSRLQQHIEVERDRRAS